MKKLIPLLLSFLLIGCASDTEQKGLDAIAALYQGKATYSKSFHSSLGEETIKSFNITVMDSERIDTLSPGMTSALIATLAYDNFSEEERESYTQVNVSLFNSKKDSAGFTFPTPLLHNLLVKRKTFNEFSNWTLNGEFQKIDGLKNNDAIPQEIGEIIQNSLATTEESYGKLIAFEPYGIGKVQDSIGELYQYQGYFVFQSNKRKPYFVVVDSKPDDERLVGFKIF
ncbi:MAG: hypothetical protein R2793_08560 [Flavobacteriaceae bacterium]